MGSVSKYLDGQLGTFSEHESITNVEFPYIQVCPLDTRFFTEVAVGQKEI
jgi:hypothetical protein